MPKFLFVIDTDPSGSPSDEDILAIFTPDRGEEVVRVLEARDACMEALAATAGVFPSKGQARAAGFSGPVPFGLALWGTDTANFFVWNPREPRGKPTIGKRRNLTERWWDWLETMRATGVRGPWSNLTRLPDRSGEGSERASDPAVGGDALPLGGPLPLRAGLKEPDESLDRGDGDAGLLGEHPVGPNLLLSTHVDDAARVEAESPEVGLELAHHAELGGHLAELPQPEVGGLDGGHGAEERREVEDAEGDVPCLVPLKVADEVG